VVAGAAALVWGQLPALTRDALSPGCWHRQIINCGFAAATRRVDVRKAITGTVETALIGRILDPFTGKAPAPNTTGSTAQLLSGTTLLKSDVSDKAGFYELIGLTAGTGRTLKGLRTSFVTANLRNNIAITASLVNGPFTDAIAGARPTGNATVTLDWRRMQPYTDTTGCIDGPCNGHELDLFVKTPAGEYVFYNNPGDLLTTPYVKFARDSSCDCRCGAGSIAFRDNGFTALCSDSYAGSASVQMYNGAASAAPWRRTLRHQPVLDPRLPDQDRYGLHLDERQHL
jgi:hypothetical protein